jgi:hypothetical protein
MQRIETRLRLATAIVNQLWEAREKLRTNEEASEEIRAQFLERRQAIKRLIAPLGLGPEPGPKSQTRLPGDSIFIKKGKPASGFAVLAEWLRSASGYLKLQDPYGSIELLALTEEVPRDLEVRLLISEINKRKLFAETLAAVRKTGRRIRVIQLVDKSEKSPFHDRWIFTQGDARLLGTSLSGIGRKDTTISAPVSWADEERQFDLYFDGTDPTMAEYSRVEL